jgi:hypothetical protein
MKTETRGIFFADRIDKILQEGLILNQDILHYIDSTFLNPSVKDLEAIINNESEPDRDAFMELIFFPDECFQARLEKILENEKFHTNDEEKIVRRLIEKQPETILIVPDTKEPLKVAMPDHAAHKFVSRMKISKQIDPNILDTISTHISPEYQDIIKVKLRNSKLSLTKRRIFFVCSFLKASRPEDSLFFQCLNFILTFLDEMDDSKNILSALLDKKNYYHQNIRKAEQFENKMAANNMETLILQGTRIPHFSKEDARMNIELIDRISLAVFGQTGYPESDYSGCNFGSFHVKKDIGKLINILS